jgi:hypothetical protein
MFDQPVRYGGVEFNSVEQLGEGKRRGTILEEFDFGRSQGVGYTEKRAQDDGLDASDVYMGSRVVNIVGVTYGSTPGDLHDQLQRVRSVLTPTIAYGFSKPDYGYIPLEFSLPTENDTDFPGGWRRLEFRARPVGQPQFSLRRDAGSENGVPNNGSFGAGILWRATLECKDPRMYLRPDIWVPADPDTTTLPDSGTLKNRGDYPAPLDILLVMPAATTATSKVVIQAGDANMTILLGKAGPPVESFPAGTVVRYSGELKVLTVQTPGAPGTDVLRMDLLSFQNDTTHPKVPPGSSGYAVTRTAIAAFAHGSRFMYSESYA